MNGVRFVLTLSTFPSTQVPEPRWLAEEIRDMTKTIRNLSDDHLRFRLDQLSRQSGKAAGKAYMAALNEAIRRENNAS